MWFVTDRFRDAVAGTHEAVNRVTLLLPGDARQFGLAPQRGYELPLLTEGENTLTLSLTSDGKRSASLTVPGDWWDRVQPYGAEVFIERGIDFGDGTSEFVPLGYLRINDLDQNDAPDGPITLTCVDRIEWVKDNRVLFPYQVPAGVTHRSIFERLINGVGGGYPAMPGATTPISFPAYDETTLVPAGSMIPDSTYEFMAALADSKDCVLRFADTGELVISARYLDENAAAVADIFAGGNLVQASRGVTRDGTYNIVSAYGSDPAYPTSYSLAYNDNANSPLRWDGTFGTKPRYYASPLLRSNAACDAATATVLSRYTGLPRSSTLDVVPNPALRPGDIIAVYLRSLEAGGAPEVRQIDTIKLPLTGSQPMEIVTRDQISVV